jgi:murein DD-endopeptidase MepM/ murein hydrolase activator NlpD
MEKYTVRFTHLEDEPKLSPGEIVKRGDLVGIMGNTGQSTGPHLHLDVVYGRQYEMWRLADVDPDGQDVMRLVPSPRQCAYFVDKELWGGKSYVITTTYCDPLYKQRFGKWHCGYDLVGTEPQIFWNRSTDGQVVFSDWDHGYGWSLMITYGAR